MTYLVFMNYLMLVAICRNMGIVTSDEIVLELDILGAVALLVRSLIKSGVMKNE